MRSLTFATHRLHLARSFERKGLLAMMFFIAPVMDAGALLVLGGLLWFLMAGSTDALRFGVGFGGILLAASCMSLRCWQESKSSAIFIVAQAGLCSYLLSLLNITSAQIKAAGITGLSDEVYLHWVTIHGFASCGT